MMNCWQNEPKARPSFTALTKQLRDMENQHKVRLSVLRDLKSILAISVMTTFFERTQKQGESFVSQAVSKGGEFQFFAPISHLQCIWSG